MKTKIEPVKTNIFLDLWWWLFEKPAPKYKDAGPQLAHIGRWLETDYFTYPELRSRPVPRTNKKGEQR